MLVGVGVTETTTETRASRRRRANISVSAIATSGAGAARTRSISGDGSDVALKGNYQFPRARESNAVVMHGRRRRHETVSATHERATASAPRIFDNLFVSEMTVRLARHMHGCVRRVRDDFPAQLTVAATTLD